MKIAPVFSTISFINRNNGQSLSLENNYLDCKKPCCDDVFVRLADASLKDKKIETELRSMGLI